MTELADTFVRSEGISFRQAHSIVSKCIKVLLSHGEESLASLTWGLANTQSKLITGKPLKISEEDFYSTLKPETFVGVRTLLGGPAPATMKESLERSKANSHSLKEWVSLKESKIVEAENN